MRASSCHGGRRLGIRERPASLPLGPRLPLLVPALLLLGSTLVAPPASAQWPGEIRGRVSDALTGDPVAGATIRVRGTGLADETDGRGTFRLRGLEPGPCVLEVSALGYETAVVRVEAENGRRTWLPLGLSPRALPVDGVVARAAPGAAVDPGGARVLDREEIRRSGSATLGELLGGVPGVTVRRRGPGGPESVSVRGSGADAVLVLVDGAPLNDPVTGEADLSSVQAGSLEEVRVLRGARTARYGPRAEGGVVLARTRDPGRAAGGSLHGGSLGLVRARGDGGLEIGSFEVGAGVEARSRDGRFSYREPAGLGGGTGERRNADLTQASVSVGADGGLGGGRLGARLSFETLERGLPGKSFAPADSARQSLDRYRASVTWDRSGDRSSLHLSGWSVRQVVSNRDPAPPLGVPYSDRGSVLALGLRGEWSRRLHERPLDRVAVGLDVDRQRVRSDALDGGAAPSRTDGGLWLQVEAGAGPGLWNARLTGTGRVHRNVGTGGWLPTHDVTLSVEPGPLDLHVAHRSAFSPPTPGDQFFREGVGVRPNPDLKAERVPGEVEAGLSGSGPVGPLRLAGGLAAYHGDVRDMIVWAPDFRFVWSPRNVDVKRRGGEGWLRLSHPGSGLSLSGSAARSRVVYDRPGRDTVQVRYRPRWTGDLRLGWEGSGSRLGVGARYTGRRYPVPAPVNGLEPFWSVDVSAGHEWLWSDWRVGLELRVDRLLDQDDSFIFAFPEPGRTFEIGLRFNRDGGSP